MQPILKPGVKVEELFLAGRQGPDNAVPLVVLSNGTAWGYWGPLKKWLKLAEAGYQVTAYNNINVGAVQQGRPKKGKAGSFLCWPRRASCWR